MELIDTLNMQKKKARELERQLHPPRKPGKPATGVIPKVHFTVIGTPEEVNYIKTFIKKRGYTTRSKFVIDNLIALFKETEEKERLLNEKKENG